MSYTVTIIDIDQNPMTNQPVQLLQNGQAIAHAVTDANGVAAFDVAFASQSGLAVCSNPTQTAF